MIKQSVEVVDSQLALFHHRLGAHHDLPEGFIFGTVLRIPAEMFARDAYALRLTVERVQGVEMAEQDVANSQRRRFW